MRKGWNVLFVSLLALSFISLLHDCAPLSAASPAPDAIKIGCTLGLTGRFAGNAIEVKDGYEIAVQHINEDGGIPVKDYGKKIPVKLIMYDDESDPTKAAARYEKLYTEDKVTAYLGSFSTVVNTSLIAVAEKNKVPIVVSHFSHLEPHRQGYKYLFSPFYKTTPDYPKILDALSDISGDKRPRRIAIVMSRTEWPMETAKVYKEKIEKGGIYELVLNETYPLGSTDFSMIIAKAKAARADVWLSSPTPPEGIAAVRQMKELDYAPQFVNMTQASSARGWPGKEKDVGEYVVALENWIPGLPWPKNERLIADAKRRLGGQLPWCGVGTGYMDVQVLAEAIERAGSLDRERVKEALTRSDIMTVGGPVKVRSDGTFENMVYLCQWQKGQYVPVWPRKYAVANPIFPAPRWSAR
jgi:branched-chain amino acid transport system substrate-binding protein